MKTIIIAPWARQLRNGKENAKNYPRWSEVVSILRSEGYHTIQIGVDGERGIGADEVKNNLSITELENLIRASFVLIGVDSMAQHLSWYIDKPCIAIWGKSDPVIFGHDTNINLFKDRKYFRLDVFRWWENIDPLPPELWITPQEVVEAVKRL